MCLAVLAALVCVCDTVRPWGVEESRATGRMIARRQVGVGREVPSCRENDSDCGWMGREWEGHRLIAVLVVDL